MHTREPRGGALVIALCALAGLAGLAGCVTYAGDVSVLRSTAGAGVAIESGVNAGMVLNPTIDAKAVPSLTLQLRVGYDMGLGRISVEMGPAADFVLNQDPLGVHAQLAFMTVLNPRRYTLKSSAGRAVDRHGPMFGLYLRVGPTRTLSRGALDTWLVGIDADLRARFGGTREFQVGGSAYSRKLVWPDPDARFN